MALKTEKTGPRRPRGTPLPVRKPASRPLLSGQRRARGKPECVNARLPGSRDSGAPASHRSRPARSRFAGPGRSPPPRCARPLTFTFRASRRPSSLQRHQRAPPQGEAGGARTRASPVAAGLPLWLQRAGRVRAQPVRPSTSYGSGVRRFNAWRGVSARCLAA